MKLITAITRPEKLDEIPDVLVLDGDAETLAGTLAEAIGKHARTGTIGDGKLWVTTVDSAARPRRGVTRMRATYDAVTDERTVTGQASCYLLERDVLDELFGVIRRRVSGWSARCCATGRIVRIDK